MRQQTRILLNVFVLISMLALYMLLFSTASHAQSLGFSDTVGAFTITATEEGTVLTDADYSYDNNTLTIKSTTPITIQNTDPATSTTDKFVIGSDTLSDADTVQLTLAGVNIQNPSSGSPLGIVNNAEFNVNIILQDDTSNTLIAKTNANSAGLQKNDNKTSETDIAQLGTLTIGAPTTKDAKRNGVLTATGGNGAGIGGGEGSICSDIQISGGVVEA